MLCSHCHPPSHLGLCTARDGGTAYACGCAQCPEFAPAVGGHPRTALVVLPVTHDALLRQQALMARPGERAYTDSALAAREAQGKSGAGVYLVALSRGLSVTGNLTSHCRILGRFEP